MKNFLKTTILAASLAVAGLAAATPSASAANAGFSIVVNGGGNDFRSGHHNRHDNRGGWNKHNRGGICAPGQALNKARSMGIHKARVVDVDRRTVKVRGYKFGRPSGAIFANDRGCPVIARR
ncbi:MAG: hypothetical protein CML29_13435 [Rhizobiales bacterium]|nr:hypothetical protein [Hyphomicrobiales bacterium]MBA69855.1 hypothetical protein [Hyphomicrobiales bacterium]